MRKTNQTDFWIEKVIKQKDDTLSFNGNLIYLLVELRRKIFYRMSYYPEPDSLSRSKIKVELNFSNYVANLTKKATGVDTSTFAKKVDSARGKLDFDK